MDDAACTFYLQDVLAPKGSYAERPGSGCRPRAGPIPRCNGPTTASTTMASAPASRHWAARASICSPLTTGLHQGEYCAIWFGPDGPTDQRRDDAQSLCFDSPPLAEPLALLGDVRLHLRLASDTLRATGGTSECGGARRPSHADHLRRA